MEQIHYTESCIHASPDMRDWLLLMGGSRRYSRHKQVSIDSPSILTACVLETAKGGMTEHGCKIFTGVQRNSLGNNTICCWCLILFHISRFVTKALKYPLIKGLAYVQFCKRFVWIATIVVVECTSNRRSHCKLVTKQQEELCVC
jgi:hypothetical protein